MRSRGSTGISTTFSFAQSKSGVSGLRIASESHFIAPPIESDPLGVAAEVRSISNIRSIWQVGAIAGAILLALSAPALAVGSPGNGPSDHPDAPNGKDGRLVEFQLLTETLCTNGHNAGLAAPSIAIVPPSLRPPDDHGAPGYRIFISCPEGYLRTAIWNPATNKLTASPTP